MTLKETLNTLDMKKILLIIGYTLAQVALMMGQWTSPGNGTTYTLRDLVTASEGCVTHAGGNNPYRIHNDLTIAPNDRLTVVADDFTGIDADAGGILCHGNVLLTIKGALVIDCEGIDVYLEPDSVSHLRVVLDHSTEPCLFNRTKMYYLGGIYADESPVTFNDCMFQSFDKNQQPGAVVYQNCDPVFANCIFQGNYGSAIACAAGSTGSPQIDRCEFRYNVLSKENMPQLDFGPGNNDTIRLLNSRVVGLYPLVSGVYVADTTQTGDTKILIKNNFIADNRYGYRQQGYAIDALILDNEIVCNQIAPDPTNDGSGIRLEGASDRCKATLRHNLIKSNLWGVTLQGHAVADLGTADDYGRNIFLTNHNSTSGNDLEYALYVEGTNDVSAIGNYWGSDTEAYAENVIYHRPDLGEDHGLVSYLPILTVNDWNVGENQPALLEAYPNPTAGVLTLKTGQDDGFAYEVYSITGQQVLHGTSVEGMTTLHLEALPAGLYSVITRLNGNKTKSIVILKQ